MTAPPFRCSDAARAREDPAVGTAPPARRWLLLEHPGPWRVDAVAGSGIDPAVLARLTRAAGRRAARILLVRRPGRLQRRAPRRWTLASLDGATVSGRWAADADLLDAADALASDPPVTTEPPSPILLVCAHGVHDVCCAVRGRPVAEALAHRWPAAVWECSHVGGCRFAPSVVVLPDGYYYGYLDPQTALDAVGSHLGGRVDPSHLRGLARFPPAAQAVARHVHARYGPLGPRDLALAGLRHTPPHRDEPARSVVDFTVPGVRGLLRGEVLEVRRAEAQLTCRAPRQTPATAYEVRSLQQVTG